MPDFSIKKKMLTIIICSIALTVMTALLAEGKSERITSVNRPETGQKEEMTVSVVEEGQSDGIELGINIASRELSDEEALDMLEQTAQKLTDIMKGSNADLDHVTGNMNFPAVINDSGVMIEWTTSSYGVVAYDGEVFNYSFEKDDAKDVSVTADMQLGGQHLKKTFNVKVLPPELGEKEQFKKDVEKAVKEADRQGAKEGSVALPVMVNGKEVSFYPAGQKSLSWVFLPLGVVFCIAVYISERRKAQEKEKKIREELERDYGNLTSRLALLCGAGINVYGAWKSIADNYMAGRKKKKKKKAAYENLVESVNMIKNGMSEHEAYIRFGNKCGLKEYKKLGAYLSEYVRKGSGNLAQLLKEETDESFERRKAQVKVKAQEAGIKMMMPMVIMLGVVMAIVMIPAFMSFVI